MLSVLRKDKVITKKDAVSKDASYMKEWLISCFPNGPCCSAAALGRVDFQWGCNEGVGAA